LYSGFRWNGAVDNGEFWLVFFEVLVEDFNEFLLAAAWKADLQCINFAWDFIFAL
jgi:hypothetical protein